jgi:lysophospholipase L1-like esterase
MVKVIHQLAKKWNIKVLDLYNDPNFKDQPALYMADEIHPTRAGYLEKWLPVFENKLTEILTKK